MYLKEVNEITEHKIVGGSDYQWHCYPDARMLDYESEFAYIGVIYSTSDQKIYEVDVSIKSDAWGKEDKDMRPYRWLNLEYKEAYYKECKQRKIKKNIAWDDVKWIDLEVEEDFLEKAQAMFEGKPFDTRIQVPIELDDDVMLKLCMEAHKLDITLNQMVEKVLRKVIETHE
jgi:hypothetical protein